MVSRFKEVYYTYAINGSFLLPRLLDVLHDAWGLWAPRFPGIGIDKRWNYEALLCL